MLYEVSSCFISLKLKVDATMSFVKPAATLPTQLYALIAFGANLPFEGLSPEDTIKAALRRFHEENMAPLSCSGFYRTSCFPIGAGPDYINGCLKINISQKTEAASVLESLHEIEAEFGREREQRWGMRTLDLDLLAIEDHVLPDLNGYLAWQNLDLDGQKSVAPREIILPHPRLHDRAFVLVPLADIAPNWCHPVRRLTVQQMLDALPQAEVKQVLVGKIPN
ncbi:MAG: 2-amino-4-hydroxy-6-hydroxymethyldihydropteridine diphosphokinase [Paracoccaceae bacterium]